MKNYKGEESKIEEKKEKEIFAKKDWVIRHNEFYAEIKKGDDVKKIVKDNKLLECLRKEQVI